MLIEAPILNTMTIYVVTMIISYDYESLIYNLVVLIGMKEMSLQCHENK